jgi:hypothetical protein
MLDKRANIFVFVSRLLTNSPYCCIQTFRAITGNFDRLVGAQFVNFGLASGSEENRIGSLGQLNSGSGGPTISPLKSISISRG